MHGVTETDPADPFDLNLKTCFSLDFFFLTAGSILCFRIKTKVFDSRVCEESYVSFPAFSFVDKIIVIPLICDFFFDHQHPMWNSTHCQRGVVEHLKNSNTPFKRSVLTSHILYCLFHFSESLYLGFQIWHKFRNGKRQQKWASL